MTELTSVLTDAGVLRDKIHSKVTNAVTSVFPVDLKGRTLEVRDVKVHGRDYSTEDQKRALLTGSSLENPVKGTLVLKGADGRVIDEAKNFTLLHVPYMTERHTIIADGNEYQFANQLRRKPGVYTQRAENGELKTVFNLGKGKNFDLGFNENKGTFYLQYGTSNIPMYAALRGIGVSHDTIAKHLGEGVANANQAAYGKQIESATAKLYQKLEHPAIYDAKAPHMAKADAVQKKYNNTSLDPEVTAHTLGKPHDKVTPVALLDAAKKMLAVHKGEVHVDDTDSLAFKTFHSADDFLAERIKLTARAWMPKAKKALSTKSTIREALKPAPFSDAIRKFVTTSTLTAVPSGINPLELMDHAVKVTALGEGGIPSDRAIPLDARMTHSTHFGALDPIRTPESFHVGVDIRATIAAHRDDKGNLYSAMRDVKTGKQVFLKAGDLVKAVVAFPHQDLKGTVRAFVNGEVQNVPGSRVTHEMMHVSHQYSPATSLIPMIHNIQGNRAIMGSKMGTQALPLIEREAPYVQVKSHFPGHVSFEDIYGHMTVPTAPVHGTVEKVENGYIYIRPHGTQKKAESRTAVIITGNPHYITNNPKAEAYYRAIEDHLAGLGYSVKRDPGAPHTSPPPADLWIGHSRGADRLRFAPAGTRTVAFGSSREGAVNHPADIVDQPAGSFTPPDEHYVLTDEMRAALGSEKKAEDRPVLEQKKLGPHTFNIEIKKNTGHKAEGQTKAKGSSEDYGHLPGYVGPDGDSLDFFVGDRHDGLLYAYDKQKRVNAKGELDPSAPWKVTDTKYVVGHSPAEAEEFHRKTVQWNSPTIRFANRRFFKDWNHLQQHIDEHHKNEKTAAARAALESEKKAEARAAVITFSKLANEQGLPAATEWLHEVEREARKRGYSLFAVLEDPKHPLGGASLTYRHPGQNADAINHARASHEEWEIAHGIDPTHDWRHGGEKKAEDRPVLEQKKLGPHTFNLEMLRHQFADEPGAMTSRSGAWDYGHLPGYTGPDGDSLDFFVGDHPTGHIFAFDKEKNVDGKGWKVTDTKFVVGLKPHEKQEFLSRIKAYNAGPLPLRYGNVRQFKDWDHLQQHIDEHHKNEKTAADDKDLVKVPYSVNFPFPSKTYLNHTLEVKPGDKVEAGQRLADSNFTRNGTLALGKNLLVAYMPYHGLNSNDAVVISEGASKRLTSEHMYREVYPVTGQIELNRDKHKSYYGNKYMPQQYAKLDESGVVKKGAKVDPKDPLVLGLTKTQIQGTDLMLGRISKALTKPYREVTLEWGHGTPGEVVEVLRSPNQIAILIKTHEQMQVGDKLAGRYGNKGVVAKVVPDHEMIKDEKGRPIDLIMTSAGVVSRINPAQIIETAVGKVAEKTGKPILYDNAEHKNAVQWARNLLKEHGVKDKEHVYDPIHKRTITGADGKGVLVGRQFIYKLFKSTDTNFAGHGVGPYDVNEQPLKTGGDDSAKGIGKMELDALFAHNARNFLQEAATVKSQKSDEFWRAVQLGMPLPAPRPSFAFNKFTNMLESSGIRVDKRGSKFKLVPLTDKGVLERSRGEIENSKTLIAKNLKPEKGGLFDPNKTGGPQGTLYSHISLHEPMPHPIFVEPVRRLLDLSQKEFSAKLQSEGGKWFHSELSKIDVEQKLKTLREQMKNAKGSDLDNVVKQIKYLEALKAEKLAPHDAYMISKVPVIPPVFRPVVPEKRDPSQLQISDPNKLYAHLMQANGVLKDTAMASDLGKHREMTFTALGAVFGTNDPDDEKLKKQQVKGFMQTIAGVGTPKGGFFQRKLMRRTQDASGRGTAVPDGNLGMDEVGIPEQMLWQMLDKLIVARLVRQGYSALQAREMVDKKAPAAREAMLAETKSRPVLINRAPTLHRWSVVAANPVPVAGKTIRVNPFVEKGMNLDYDGDTLQVHVPIQHGAVEDANKMKLSNMLLADQQRNQLMAFPQHESIIGFTLASKAAPASTATHHFNTPEEAKAAWRSGKLKLTDTITIAKEKRAAYEEPETIAPLSSEEALFFWPAESVTGYEDQNG